MLDAITIEPSTPAEYTLIWLHGLGAGGYDFVPMASTLQKYTNLSMRFIFPHAPLRPVTLNQGYVMRAWYDITGLTLDAREDQQGLAEVSAAITQLIQQQKQSGIPTTRIFLGGFSQGAGAILYTGLRYSEQLAGLISLSGYLPLGKTLEKEKSAANQHIPLFWGHGETDTTVPLAWADISCRWLKASEFKIQFHTYKMGHEVCEQEIEALGNWLTQKAAMQTEAA